MMWPVPEVINRELLEERFGSWPSFHDAEVYAVRLDSGQRSTGRPSLELDIHVFGADVRHTLATLLFDGVEALELRGFSAQNVLDDLVFEDLDRDADGVFRIAVSAPSNWGMSGAFRCEAVTVVNVTPFEPGPHSVYRAADP